MVASLLRPSEKIRPEYRTVRLRLASGAVLRGRVAERSGDSLTLLDINQPGKPLVVALDEVEQERQDDKSMMPEGLASQLSSRKQFLDLVKYVVEVSKARAGPGRRSSVRRLLAAARRPLPEYESHVDHAGVDCR